MSAGAEFSQYMQFGSYASFQSQRESREDNRDITSIQNDYLALRESTAADEDILQKNKDSGVIASIADRTPRQLPGHPAFNTSVFHSAVGDMSEDQKYVAKAVLAEEYTELLQEQERIQSNITLVKSFLEEK